MQKSTCLFPNKKTKFNVLDKQQFGTQLVVLFQIRRQTKGQVCFSYLLTLIIIIFAYMSVRSWEPSCIAAVRWDRLVLTGTIDHQDCQFRTSQAYNMWKLVLMNSYNTPTKGNSQAVKVSLDQQLWFTYKFPPAFSALDQISRNIMQFALCTNIVSWSIKGKLVLPMMSTPKLLFRSRHQSQFRFLSNNVQC
jgi:hypothetical protein